MKFTRWGLFDISRKDIKFTRVYGMDQDDELLTTILPFGSPLNWSTKYISIDNRTYISCLKLQGQGGKGIVLVFDSEVIPDNLLGILPELAKLIEKAPSDSALEIEPKELPTGSIRIKNLDMLIFSFLARLKTVILGDETEITESIRHLFFLIPKEMRKTFQFVTQSNSLSENVDLIGMPFSEEILKDLGKSRGDYTIVILGDQVYGQFTSQFCKKIAKLIALTQYDLIKEEVAKFFQIVIESEDLSSALDFAKEKGLHLSDAQLALIMRSKYFRKEVPHGLLEV